MAINESQISHRLKKIHRNPLFGLNSKDWEIVWNPFLGTLLNPQTTECNHYFSFRWWGTIRIYDRVSIESRAGDHGVLIDIYIFAYVSSSGRNGLWWKKMAWKWV